MEVIFMDGYKNAACWIGKKILVIIQALMIPFVNLMGFMVVCFIRVYYFFVRH